MSTTLTAWTDAALVVCKAVRRFGAFARPWLASILLALVRRAIRGKNGPAT